MHTTLPRDVSSYLFGNGRGIGLTELLQAEVSLPVVVLFAVVSQLGDVWFLFLLVGVLYVVGEYTPPWNLSRREGLFVLATFLTYIAFVGVVKGVFALPRPPGAAEPPAIESLPATLELVFDDITTGTGPGFPSGHALGTTMVWGALALVFDRWPLRTRAALAGGVVTLVSLSRLVLGVHYAVDVLVGSLVGLVALAALYRLSADAAAPGRVLGVAVAVGAVGLVQTVTFESVAAAGGAVGGWLAWRSVGESVSARAADLREVGVGVTILVAAGAGFGAVYTSTLPHALTFVVTGTIVAAVVAAPFLSERAA